MDSTAASHRLAQSQARLAAVTHPDTGCQRQLSSRSSQICLFLDNLYYVSLVGLSPTQHHPASAIETFEAAPAHTLPDVSFADFHRRHEMLMHGERPASAVWFERDIDRSPELHDDSLRQQRPARDRTPRGPQDPRREHRPGDRHAPPLLLSFVDSARQPQQIGLYLI